MTEQLPTERVEISTLSPYYRNPRHGDVGAIAESLSTLGQYRHVVVNVGTLTGRPNEIAAGNHTVRAAERLGWESIDVSYVDVDEQTLAKIVLADNRTNDLATYDSQELVELLLDLQANSDLDGTGYNTDDLDRLYNDLETSLAEQYAGTGDPSVDLERVPFRFGDYSGVVERSTYDRFVAAYATELDGDSLLLDDVLRKWLP